MKCYACIVKNAFSLQLLISATNECKYLTKKWAFFVYGNGKSKDYAGVLG